MLGPSLLLTHRLRWEEARRRRGGFLLDIEGRYLCWRVLSVVVVLFKSPTVVLESSDAESSVGNLR